MKSILRVLIAMSLASCARPSGPQAPRVAAEPSEPGSACSEDSEPSCVDLAEAKLVATPPDVHGAAAILQEACDREQAAACGALGTLHANGRLATELVPEPGAGLTTASVKAAQPFLVRACELGSGNGCAQAAKVLVGQQRFQQARAKAARGCELNAPAGCRAFAGLLWQGLGGNQDRARARAVNEKWKSLLEDGCAKGDKERCAAAGTGSWWIDGDLDGAVRYWEKACALGEGTACGFLGAFIWAGAKSGTPDLERALPLLTKACDLHDAYGCAVLGRAHAHAGDFEQARARWKRACALGGQRGCFQLGAGHRQGQGVPQSDIKAVELYRRACLLHSPSGCNGLAWMLREGLGAPRNRELATWLFEATCAHYDVTSQCTVLRNAKSCKSAAAAACNDAGNMAIETGDPTRAAPYFEKSCSLGYEIGCKNFARTKAQGAPVLSGQP